jgi:hypothetical protein
LRDGIAISTSVARGRYRVVYVLGSTISEHIAIWAIKMGAYPKKSIDHINRDGNDNRWENLREANPSEQQANRALFKNSKSGLRGVYFNRGKWVAAVRYKNKMYQLGRFSHAEEASCAVEAKRKEFWGEFASSSQL